MTKIKMCGMTREADVLAAAELGVDAVGFVLWPGSPRAVTAASAARLVRLLPPFVTPVAVLVDATADDVARAREEAGCTLFQLHGRVVESGIEACWSRVVRAASLGAGDELIVPDVPKDVTVLLDAHDPVRHGGTGQCIDWAGAGRVARGRRVILAGGLTRDNVREAIETVRPYGVDVASGIEREAGVKDPQRMRAFVAAVRGAGAGPLAVTSDEPIADIE